MKNQIVEKKIGMMYLIGFVMALSLAIPTYVTSTYLSDLVSEKSVGIFYTLSSLIAMIVLIWSPTLLGKIGNLRAFKIFSLSILASLLVIAFSPTILPILIAFIVYLTVTSVIFYNLDVFLEDFSEDEKTGGIRGTYLTFMNLAWVFSPLMLSYLLTNHDYWKVYSYSAFLLIPALILVTKNFKNFKDPVYERTPFIKTLKIVWEQKNIKNIFISSFLLNFFYSWMVIYTPIYLYEYIGFSWATIGIIFTIMLLPFVFLEYPLGQLADKKIGEKEILNLGFIITGIATIALSFLTSINPLVWGAVLFMTRVGASMIEVASETYFFKKISSSDANIISTFRIARPMAYVAGPVVASLTLNFISLKNLFVVLGVMVVVFGLMYGVGIKDTR